MIRGRTCLALVVVGWLALLPATATGEGMLRIETPHLELGEVKAGTPAVGKFVFHNEGDRDITILRAKPS